MSIVLFILALAAAFIGTIFAFRAISRIHSGESYTDEAEARAVYITRAAHRIYNYQTKYTACHRLSADRQGAASNRISIKTSVWICCPLTGVTMAAGVTRLVLQAPAGFSIGV